uniref:RING-type domain-containing protein n=1 Tax=Strigamia maritima TaxID=126957 RepID=T1J5G7_STRMM
MPPLGAGPGPAMGQRLGRHHMEHGLRLYQNQRPENASRCWRRALRLLTDTSDRFIALGYLCDAHSDCGRYGELVACGLTQLDLATRLDSPSMRAQAYLNLARGAEKQGDFGRTLDYCHHALRDQAHDPCLAGHAHLVLGAAYLGLANFAKAVEYYDAALRLAGQLTDSQLQVLALIGLGQVFAFLKDYEKSLRFHSRAHEISKSLSCKFVRLALVHLVTPLRKLGRLAEAADCCQEALQMSLQTNDRPSQARCLLALGDIYRNRNELERAHSQYEMAFSLLKEMDDRLGQAQVLMGMAKTMTAMKRQSSVCDCKALEINNKALEISTALGNKLFMYYCHVRLEEIYGSLGDEINRLQEERLAMSLAADLDRVCGVCRQEYGDTPAPLEALPCAHIFHAKCVREVLQERERRRKKRTCPECRRTLGASRTFLDCDQHDSIM